MWSESTPDTVWCGAVLHKKNNVQISECKCCGGECVCVVGIQSESSHEQAVPKGGVRVLFWRRKVMHCSQLHRSWLNVLSRLFWKQCFEFRNQYISSVYWISTWNILFLNLWFQRVINRQSLITNHSITKVLNRLKLPKLNEGRGTTTSFLYQVATHFQGELQLVWCVFWPCEIAGVHFAEMINLYEKHELAGFWKCALWC